MVRPDPDNYDLKGELGNRLIEFQELLRDIARNSGNPQQRDWDSTAWNIDALVEAFAEVGERWPRLLKALRDVRDTQCDWTPGELIKKRVRPRHDKAEVPEFDLFIRYESENGPFRADWKVPGAAVPQGFVVEDIDADVTS